MKYALFALIILTESFAWSNSRVGTLGIEPLSLHDNVRATSTPIRQQRLTLVSEGIYKLEIATWIDGNWAIQATVLTTVELPLDTQSKLSNPYFLGTWQ